MLPSVLASQVRRGIEDFLRTTFPIHTPHFDGVLERLLDASSREMVVFQKWRWPCLHRPSKGIAIDKQADHDVMHLRGFREADRLAHQAFNARS